jgi:hypothetical protein
LKKNNEPIFDKEVDLDEELRKLEQMKLNRQQQYQSYRDKVNEEKLKAIHNMYFKDQMAEMKQMQDESPDGHIYFSPRLKPKAFKDWDLKQAPDHRKTLSTSEQLKASQLNFFYGEEETSERVWRIDHRLSVIYKYLVRAVLIALSVALFLHVRHRYQMRYFAS